MDGLQRRKYTGEWQDREARNRGGEQYACWDECKRLPHVQAGRQGVRRREKPWCVGAVVERECLNA